jgi:immune inhibitor A
MRPLLLSAAIAAVTLSPLSPLPSTPGPVPRPSRPAREPSAGGASAAPGRNAGKGHVKPLPAYVRKRERERVVAADLVARGLATANAEGVVSLSNGRKVKHRVETEFLTVALIDFTDVLHGQIPAPDRSKDNSTYWSADVSPRHYRDMLFTAGGGSYGLPSMSDYYLQQSSGRFTWKGQVGNWVRVNATESQFGGNSPESGDGGDDANGPVYRVVDATVKGLAASGNYGGLDLSKADKIDRYDCDGDGNFKEPDGYVDHFAIVHAGEGEEAGGGAQAGDAIWSHRWYANFNQTSGPTGCKLGGYNIPGTKLWVGDYTIEPENGGVGVFAHEFGHDLGLPDLYDTTGGSDNATGFWSIMSVGSWASDSRYALGDKPVHMGAWEKLTLGWLDETLAQVELGADTVVDLGPAEGATRGKNQALRVNLPPLTQTTNVFPVDGADANYFYSGTGDGIDVNMTRAFAAAAATPISFRAAWDIELDWDYAYLEAQVAGVWQPVQTSASTSTNPNGQNFGFGITGASAGWVTVTATLPAGTAALRFRHWTDGAFSMTGFAVDSIALAGTVDDATNPALWTLNGFRQLTNGQYTQTFVHYYLAESRSYIANDRSLCGAYNFISGNWVERECYADGLLIWYRNSAFNDNNTSVHPGAGQILPVDAHPAVALEPDGKEPWAARWQIWDATFGVDTHRVTLSQVLESGHTRRKTYQASPVSSFHDSSPTAYWRPAQPFNSVKTAGSGLKIDIKDVSRDRSSYKVRVH